MNRDRRLEAKRVREDAAQLAHDRVHPTHRANGDEQKYASAHYAMSFTKGLDHDKSTGLVKDKWHFESFRRAIDNGVIEPFTAAVPVPRQKGKERRVWEAPTAGVVYDLEGPDAQAVTMPPAPALCSDELNFEMAEVYELALLRDTPFFAFDGNGGPGSAAINDAVDRLNKLTYAKEGFSGRPRKADVGGQLDLQTVFRGSSPGVDVGPYISQFLLIGNQDQAKSNNPKDGEITYGAQSISQKVLEAEEGDDYMMRTGDWHEVQQGFKPKGSQNLKKNRRWIHTPRDLATYVHFDALYQSYLNACLILLGNGTPFDPSFENLSGVPDHRVLVGKDSPDSIMSNTGGFALYGGPHILTLVTEVATRALKAVRYQKFNNHLRLRPEALAGRLEYAKKIDKNHPELCGAFTKMAKDLVMTTDVVKSYNKAHTNGGDDTVLLPMAFAEGSPMHPTYGAGHATVAGACVTILKAFFDTSAVFAKINGVAGFYGSLQLQKAKDDKQTVEFMAYQSEADGKKLAEVKNLVKGKKNCPLTLEGELNKLAANISIGRNMAGVHYFSDYYDSARMGEEIAIGMLQEQALCYPLDSFVMSIPTFDGDVVRIGRR